MLTLCFGNWTVAMEENVFVLRKHTLKYSSLNELDVEASYS